MSTNPFPLDSRYHDVEVAEHEREDGARVPYLRRRFIPPSSTMETIGEHRVRQGDRLDNIAAQQLGNPLLAWRICDANDALRPEELTEVPGRRLRITLPPGVPGGGRGA